MAEEFIIKITDDFKAAVGGGGGGGSSGGNSSGGNKGGGAGLLGVGAALGGAFAIGTEIVGILKEAVGGLLTPIKNIVTGILRLVAELLRPISDVIVILLQPILNLLRPLIQMFRTMMQPFLGIAREFGRMANQQIAAGNMTGAIDLSLQAAQAVIGPFIVSLTSLTLQLAMTSLTGILGRLSSVVINGIGNLLALAFPIFGEKIIAGSASIANDIEAGLANANNAVNEFLTSTTQDLLTSMLEDAQAKLDEYKEKYPADYSSIMVETPAGAIEEMKKSVEEDSTAMQSSMVTAVKDMNDTTGSVFDPKSGTATTKFKEGLTEFEKATVDFVGSLEQAAATIRNIDTTPKKPKKRSLLEILGLK